jgi:hypothetical protein
MIEAVLIIAFSLVLFVYWFRYTVLLLLSEDQADERQAETGQLSVFETREALRRTQGELALDRLHRSLEKDYRMLRYLMQHAADLGLRPVEHYLLMLDYWILGVWYRLTRNASAERARRALEEMADILDYVARKMGQRAGSPSRV